jgi:hypothetical protein
MNIFCGNCGNTLTTAFHFCPICGVSTTSYDARPDSPTVSASILSASHSSQISATPVSHPGYIRSLHPDTDPPQRLRRQRWFHDSIRVGLLVSLLINAVLLAFIISMVSHSASAIFSNKTPVASATPLYTENWSQGFDGWVGTSDWSVVNGMLHNDGTDTTGNAPTIIAPYQVTGRSDYAVEVRMQVLAGGNCFDVTTLRASGPVNAWQGYKEVICSNYAQIIVGAITGGSSDHLAQVEFYPGALWHLYRFEVQGTTLSLAIDGKVVLTVTDGRYTSGGQLGFKSSVTQLNISSFQVFAV